MSQGFKERRAAFRVAIRPGSGLQAAFVVGGKIYEARASNLSANGIFFRPVEQRAAPRLSVADRVDVEVKYEGLDLRLRGVVCYRRDGGYGIHFPRQDSDGYLNPREQLGRIADALQRRSVSLPGGSP